MAVPAKKTVTIRTLRSTRRRTFEVWPDASGASNGRPVYYQLGSKDDIGVVGATPTEIEVPREHFAKFKATAEALAEKGELAIS